MPKREDTRPIKVKVRDLIKRFGDLLVLGDMPFNICKDELVCVVESTGCGETTLLNCLTKIHMSSKGGLYIDRVPADPYKRNVSLVFQEPSALPWLVVEGNLAYGLKTKRAPKVEISRRVNQIPDLMGLQEFRKACSGKLPVSAEQRVIIGRSFTVQPGLLPTDEPYRQMDMEMRFYLEGEIICLWKELGSTVVFIAHNIKEAVYLAGCMPILSNKPAKIKEGAWIDLPRPKDIASSQFIQYRNYITDKIRWQQKCRIGGIENIEVLCLSEPGNLVIRDLFVPELRGGQAIVKMKIYGICGLDMTACRGVDPTIRYPVNELGHGSIGIIQEIGGNDEGLKPGDRVALEPCVPCSEYHICATGRFNDCADFHIYGVHKDNMMSEYFLYPIQLSYRLPDELTFTHVALVEPLTVSLHGATGAGVPRGEYCITFGTGIIGLMIALAYINHGTAPILVDVLQRRLGYAEELGVPCTFNSKDGSAEEYLREVTSNKLPEAMIDCTGAPVILKNVHNYVCHGGRIALVGWPHDPVLINTVCLMQKEIDVYPPRSSDEKFPGAIDLINEGRVPTDTIIIKVIELGRVGDTVKDMIQSPSDYLKVIVST